jgi:hypothetical protein
MSPTSLVASPAELVEPSHTSASHRHGRLLLVARVAWITLALLIAAFFLANLPVYFVQMRTVCRHPVCVHWQLTPATAQALRQIHLSPTGYALVSLLFSVVCASVWFAIAVVIVWRQSRQWLALLTSLLLVAQCIIQLNGSFETPLEYSAPLWHPATLFVGALGIVLYILVFSLFPSGRFVPGWTRWAVLLVPVVFWVYASLVPWPAPADAELLLTPLSVGVTAGLVGSIMVAQIYRYQRVSTPVERQQTKWAVLGIIEGPLVGILYFSLPVFIPALGQPDSVYFVLVKPVYNLLWLFVPVCFGIAMLRYHLWDIDVIIRRTLVYGTLTALLAALYFGVVIGLQALVGSVNSATASSPVIIVATTLLIAGLFDPLRRDIQAFIDQRFYRHKYNAAKTVATFSATLRSEVALERLREQLVTVVQETMQPEQVSLWLRAPEVPHARRAPWPARTFTAGQVAPNSTLDATAADPANDAR